MKLMKHMPLPVSFGDKAGQSSDSKTNMMDATGTGNLWTGIQLHEGLSQIEEEIHPLAWKSNVVGHIHSSMRGDKQITFPV